LVLISSSEWLPELYHCPRTKRLVPPAFAERAVGFQLGEQGVD